MHNARFKVMAGLAGATLCLFAVTSYAQTPATTGTGADASAQTTPAPTTTTDPATTQTTTEQVTTTTSTETWSFPGGTLGILAVAVLVLLVLFALFRGRDRDTTVVKETYTATPPVTRTTGIGTADDRNINSRAASGTGTNPGGINDPNARR